MIGECSSRKPRSWKKSWIAARRRCARAALRRWCWCADAGVRWCAGTRSCGASSGAGSRRRRPPATRATRLGRAARSAAPCPATRPARPRPRRRSRCGSAPHLALEVLERPGRATTWSPAKQEPSLTSRKETPFEWRAVRTQPRTLGASRPRHRAPGSHGRTRSRSLRRGAHHHQADLRHVLDGEADALAPEAAVLHAAVGHVVHAPGGNVADHHAAHLEHGPRRAGPCRGRG